MKKEDKCNWKRISKVLMLFLFLLSATNAFGQKTVSGKVVDEAGEPLIGVNVIVHGTAIGNTTDINGSYTIPNVPSNSTLVVSYIGFLTQNIPVNGRSLINITLIEDTKAIDEVVVVGYGTQKKSDVTGALAHITSDQITAMPVNNALEGMQGKAAGVDITNSQRPGTVGSINVRGVRSLNASNSPLYVVDGMIIQNGGIEYLNPQDIESIEVLKDASATAIYGSRGANGVVLVTTKKGSEGKVTLNYAGTVTFSHMKEVAEYMDAAEWLDYSRWAYYNMGAYGTSSTMTPNYDLDKSIYGSVAESWANIDQAWVDGVYHPELVGSYDWVSKGKQTGITTEHTLSASGGTDRFKGYGSFGYMQQKGVIPGQEYKRFTLNTSFEAKPLPYFTMGTTMNATYGDQDYGYNFSKSVTGAGDYYGALRGMLPWTVPYDSDGNYIRLPNGDVNIINPIDELKYNTNERRNFRASGSVFALLDIGELIHPLQGLSYKISFGPELQYYRLGTANAADGINGDGNNSVVYTPYQKVSWTLDNLLYYNRTFADIHSLGLTFLQSASAYHYETATIRANVASAEELWYNTSSLSSPLAYTTGLTDMSMASYMVRLNYGLMDRYLLTASVRWDGASQLSKGHKWASFPSLALAWRLDQESFLRDLPWLSNLKLRLGYGISGNAAINAYATKGALQSATYTWGSTTETGYMPSDASARTPNKMANQELSWERTTQYNLGIDFGFFQNRLGGSFDIYKTHTKDLLMAMTIPSLTGYTSTYANVGETSGWGIDFQLNAVPIKNRDFEWNTTFTWSLDRSKIKALSNGNTEDTSNLWFVGEEIGVYYNYVYDGIWTTDEAETAASYGAKPGQIRVKDLNNDGVINAEDRAIVGKIRPRWTAGWQNTFTFHNFELSFFLYSRWKFTVPHGSLTLDGRYMMRKIDYWIPGVNENAEYYGPGTNGQAADTYSTSMGYQDGSFIKMRNISLGYNFKPNQLKSLGLNSLKIYVQAMNPFTVYKKCKWLDTDLLTYANNTTGFGSETTVKSFVIGVNVGF